MVNKIEIVKWGIIGCGDVTEVKSGPGFQIAKNSELIAVMRRNAELAKDYAERHNVSKWYRDADQLINDPEINAVYVATPPSSHKEYVLKAAKAGKHVYVEKPMAMNFGECTEMINACKANNVKLFSAFYRRGLPRFRKIKEIIVSGEIGKVRAVNTIFLDTISPKDTDKKNWRIDPATAGCGYFCDLAPHTLDILQFFLGKVKNSSGFRSNQTGIYSAEDSVSLTMQFESGVQFSGVWNFSSYTKLDKTEIIGEKGKIEFPTFDLRPINIETKKGLMELNIQNPKHIQLPLIQLIVDDILGKSNCPSTGETGAETNKIIDTII